MRIATFNVNSVRARLEVLTRWLKDKRPDMLFMQETKTKDENFPVPAFAELGYTSYFRGEKSYNGVAVLVKEGLDVQVCFGFEDGEYDTRVLMLKLGELTVLNTYVPQGREVFSPSYDEKKEFLGRVKQVILWEKNGLFLWLGDMNVAPEAIDVTHPENKQQHVCFTQEIREIFADTRSGLTDLVRKFDASEKIFTFYDYRVKDAVSRGIGWRIDHMLASERLSELSERCRVDVEPRSWDKPSDHVPLVGEFRLE